MNRKSKNVSNRISRGLVSFFSLAIVVFLSGILQTGPLEFAYASQGKQPVILRSFVNLFRLDVSRSSFGKQFQKEAVEAKTLSFEIDPSECFLYLAPEGYDYLRVSDLKPVGKAGEPLLPMKTFVVELGKDDQVYGVEVVDGLAREIDGELNIVPAAEPSVWEPGAKSGRHIPDEVIYGLGRPFPGKLVASTKMISPP